MWAHFFVPGLSGAPVFVQYRSLQETHYIQLQQSMKAPKKKSDYKEHADNCSLWRKESLLLQPRMDGRTTREGQADRCSEQRQNKKRIH